MGGKYMILEKKGSISESETRIALSNNVTSKRAHSAVGATSKLSKELTAQLVRQLSKELTAQLVRHQSCQNLVTRALRVSNETRENNEDIQPTRWPRKKRWASVPFNFWDILSTEFSSSFTA